MDRLRNLTPHAITLYDCVDDTKFVLEPSGVLRLTSLPQRTLTPYAGRVRVTTPQIFDGFDGVPEIDTKKTDGIIVSLVVAEYLKRNELDLGVLVFTPGELVRDEFCRPCGARTLELHSTPTRTDDARGDAAP